MIVQRADTAFAWGRSGFDSQSLHSKRHGPASGLEHRLASGAVRVQLPPGPLDTQAAPPWFKWQNSRPVRERSEFDSRWRQDEVIEDSLYGVSSMASSGLQNRHQRVRFLHAVPIAPSGGFRALVSETGQ